MARLTSAPVKEEQKHRSSVYTWNIYDRSPSRRSCRQACQAQCQTTHLSQYNSLSCYALLMVCSLLKDNTPANLYIPQHCYATENISREYSLLLHQVDTRTRWLLIISSHHPSWPITGSLTALWSMSSSPYSLSSHQPSSSKLAVSWTDLVSYPYTRHLQTCDSGPNSRMKSWRLCCCCSSPSFTATA